MLCGYCQLFGCNLTLKKCFFILVYWWARVTVSSVMVTWFQKCRGLMGCIRTWTKEAIKFLAPTWHHDYIWFFFFFLEFAMYQLSLNSLERPFICYQFKAFLSRRDKALQNKHRSKPPQCERSLPKWLNTPAHSNISTTYSQTRELFFLQNMRASSDVS